MTGFGLRRAAALACALAGGLTLAALAQEPARRVKLPADADTNDAAVYYQYGLQVVRNNPRTAAQAFYWAHRLSPDWPDPLYGRWLAMLLGQRGRLPEYLEGSSSVVRSKAFRSIDSLYFQALMLNPFLYRKLDRLLFDAYLEIVAQRFEAESGRRQNMGDVQFELERYLKEAPFVRAWMAYAEGRFGEAVQGYTSALKLERHKAGILAARARASFLRPDHLAALEDLTAALAELRASENQDRDLIYLYDSKALFEHSIAVVYESMALYDSARVAYARALQEDLSYYQAHVRLAVLALAGGDTATAISEYDLAGQIRGQDPVVRYKMGVLLRAQGRCAESVEQLKAGITAEPLFAPSYLELGRAYETLGQPEEASAQYQAFMTHAARANVDLPWVRQRLDAIRGGAGER
jgi:tetratricopeptide (TPR) repeat protein